MPECWWNKNTKIKSNLLTRFQLPLGTYPQTVRVPSLFLKYNIHARNTPKSYSVQLSLQHIKSILTPGPLYLLFPLPRMPLPQIFISSLSSDITSSKCRATRFKKKKSLLPRHSKSQHPVLFTIYHYLTEFSFFRFVYMFIICLLLLTVNSTILETDSAYFLPRAQRGQCLAPRQPPENNFFLITFYFFKFLSGG